LVTGKAPTDTDIAAVVKKISQRVICMLRRLGCLETGMDTAAAIGYAPLCEDTSKFARTLAASV
jgi:hypothetical protein